MKRFIGPPSNRGSALAFAVIFAGALAVLLLMLASFEKVHSSQTNYILQMNRTTELAESGTNTAVALLSKDPTAFDKDVSDGGLNNKWTDVPEEKGAYKLTVGQRNIPLPGIYYIVCTAKRNIDGKDFVMRLHTYARISNAGEYFAAVNDKLHITHGANLANARVYGLSVYFQRSADWTYGGEVVGGSLLPVPPTKTVVKNADFISVSGPAVTCEGTNCEWSPAGIDTKTDIQREIEVTDGGADEAPTRLNAPILLPQILPADILYYKGLAGAHITKQTFTGNTFPPGYINKDALDTYAGHTENNAEHVYYFDGPINVEGTFYGQVLIVSNSDIHVTGSIMSADINYPLPGRSETVLSSSTAHQVVLIPGPNKNVIIENSVWAGGPSPKVVEIQALVLAPNGSIESNVSSNQNNMKLHFFGSMILGKEPALAASFNNKDAVPFSAPRVYEYNDSLRTNPPAYLPALTEIYHSLTEVVTTPGIF